MLITRIESRLVRVPVAKSRSLPRADDPSGAGPAHETHFIAQVETDTGHAGTACIVVAAGRAVQAIVDEHWSKLLVGTDPRLIERHYARAQHLCPGLTRGGCEAQAYAALDIAMWDLKAQAAGVALHQLLGGARDAAPAYVADTIRAELSADQVVDLAKLGLDAGLTGLWVGVSGRDPVRDAQKLQRVRDELGDEVWFGVCGHQGLDLNTGLAFGRFLEEELDADVYCDPCPTDDVDAYSRLSLELELTMAVGGGLGSIALRDLIGRTRVGILRPDLGRVGGITPLLKLAALAETNHRIVMPIGNPVVTTQLACGLPAVAALDWEIGWLNALSVDKSSGKVSPGDSGPFLLRHSGLDA